MRGWSVWSHICSLISGGRRLKGGVDGSVVDAESSVREDGSSGSAEELDSVTDSAMLRDCRSSQKFGVSRWLVLNLCEGA